MIARSGFTPSTVRYAAASLGAVPRSSSAGAPWSTKEPSNALASHGRVSVRPGAATTSIDRGGDRRDRAHITFFRQRVERNGVARIGLDDDVVTAGDIA